MNKLLRKTWCILLVPESFMAYEMNLKTSNIKLSLLKMITLIIVFDVATPWTYYEFKKIHTVFIQK